MVINVRRSKNPKSFRGTKSKSRSSFHSIKRTEGYDSFGDKSLFISDSLSKSKKAK